MSQLITPPVIAPSDTYTTFNPRRYYNPVEQAAATLVQSAEESGGACTLIDVEVAPAAEPGSTTTKHMLNISRLFRVNLASRPASNTSR